MNEVRHFYVTTIKDGISLRMVISVDIEAIARRLGPRVRKSKHGLAQAMYGAVKAERVATNTEIKS